MDQYSQYHHCRDQDKCRFRMMPDQNDGCEGQRQKQNVQPPEIIKSQIRGRQQQIGEKQQRSAGRKAGLRRTAVKIQRQHQIQPRLKNKKEQKKGFGCHEVQNQLINEAATKAYAKAKNLARALHVKIRRIHKIYDPNCEIEGMNQRFYAVKSFGAVNSADGMNGTQNNQQPVPKRKMKIFLRMDVEIK